MLVFGALLSPYVRKVCLIAAEKGLPYELKMSSHANPDPDFVAASPFGKIPAIKDGDYLLADSSAIAVYLDSQYPQARLIPTEAKALGRVIWFDEYADTILAGSGVKVLFNRLVAPKILKIPFDEAIAAQGEAELPRLYAYLETVAAQSEWLAGDEFTLADISVASVLRSLSYVKVDPKAETYPAIAAWYAKVCARPAWQAVAAQEMPAKKA